MATTRKETTDTKAKDGRKQRLSSALRDNLKRRKAAPRPKKPDMPANAQK